MKGIANNNSKKKKKQSILVGISVMEFNEKCVLKLIDTHK